MCIDSSHGLDVFGRDAEVVEIDLEVTVSEVPLNGRSRSIIIDRLGTRNQIALIQFPQKAGAVIGTG